MSRRVTQQMLENKADYLNRIMNRPATGYTVTKEGPNKRFKSNIGHYTISYAYGGACLHEITSEGGGVRCPVGSYHRPKRELLEAMDHFISGIFEVEQIKAK
jgi:hypothetical protein